MGARLVGMEEEKGAGGSGIGGVESGEVQKGAGGRVVEEQQQQQQQHGQ